MGVLVWSQEVKNVVGMEKDCARLQVEGVIRSSRSLMSHWPAGTLGDPDGWVNNVCKTTTLTHKLRKQT